MCISGKCINKAKQHYIAAESKQAFKTTILMNEEGLQGLNTYKIDVEIKLMSTYFTASE